MGLFRRKKKDGIPLWPSAPKSDEQVRSDFSLEAMHIRLGLKKSKAKRTRKEIKKKGL